MDSNLSTTSDETNYNRETTFKRNEYRRHRRGSGKISTFSRGRSNFSSGTLPRRPDESTPVNTLSTGHSSKILIKSYRLDREKTYRTNHIPPDRNENGGSDEEISRISTTSSPHIEEDDVDDETERFDLLSSIQDSPCPTVHSSFIDRFAYPMNRMYLNERSSIYRFRNNRLLDQSIRRFSLPSTHILYEKNRHKGGPNITEQEKVTEMLRAKAAEQEMEHSGLMDDYALNIDLDILVKIIGPVQQEDNFMYLVADPGLMKEFYDKVFDKSFVEQITWARSRNASRAAYEEQSYIMEAHIRLKKLSGTNEQHEIFNNFIENTSRRLKYMLHDQSFLEIPSFKNIYSKIYPQHADVPISTISMGNFPNQGLFFVRGDYITQENAICSLKLYPPNTSDTSRESHSFKVAGKNPFLSYGKFEHDKRQLSIYFGIRLQDLQQDGLEYAGYRLTLYYNSFVKMIIDLSQEKTNSIYIQLKHPPQLWESIPKASSFHPSKARVLNMETCIDWVRVLSWPGDADGRGIGCSREAFSQSNWVRIVMRKDDDQFTYNAMTQFMEIASRLAVRSNAKVLFGPVFSIRRKLAPRPIMKSVGSFRANYSIQALLTRGSIVTDQLFDVAATVMPDDPRDPLDECNEPLFLRLVRRAMKECSRACEETLEQIINSIDERRLVDLLDAFSYLYKMRKIQYERVLLGEKNQDVGLVKPLPKNCVSVAKVMVCPTRVLLMPPEVMMINRVVRKFGPDYALRCVFRDDNGGRLVLRDFSLGNIDHVSNIVSETIYNTLKYGIYIADRVYSFLGWSNSQMRDQGCYLYAPRVNPVTGRVTGTVDEIRAWMGDFREAVSVPKMMSRMGQCFTQAQPTVKLTANHWNIEEDIIGGINEKYCFSDGCGRISLKLASKIAKILKLKEVPACYQVRYKGFKGILVIDPMMDEIVGMPKVMFRKSQRKFLDNSKSNVPDYLEIVKYAMPSPVCLNRPFITILDQVSEKQSALYHHRIVSRIHYYLERELNILSNMLVNEKCAADELMNRTNIPIDWRTASCSCGFQLTTDPFVRKMIVSVYRYNIIHHISKAKIFLPGNMGRSMYGVVDETGLLQSGQIFIQYSPSLRQTSNKPILLTGNVLVTKNPCHVPGDVRIFEAVNIPALKHLVDVVVFPQHGPRPHPDEMAGSDLDGDEYSVIWDPELMLLHNEKAMIFPSSSASEDDKEPTTDDMVEFFLKYLQQDSIGRMSNAHLAFADLHGLFHEHCHSIALKCAVAVDFPKSGIPAEPLAKYEQCDASPDYMLSGTKPMYYSTRLNGQLYRKARKVEEILEGYERCGCSFEADYDRLICPDDYDVFNGNEQQFLAAIAIKDEYSQRIQQLLDEYGIEDEASIVSGHAAVIKRLAGMEKDDYSFYHTDKIVELRYEKLYYSFRKKFFAEFGGEETYIVNENRKNYLKFTAPMREKARQWYYVAYVLPLKNEKYTSVGQSLPWICWEVLCDLRRTLVLDNELTILHQKYPIATKFSEEIRKSISQRNVEFDHFCDEIENKSALFLKRYAEVYGKSLLELVFVINNWLVEEKVLPSDDISILHVARLLIQCALGILEMTQKIDYERKYLSLKPVFAKMLCSDSIEDCDIDPNSEFDIGTLLIDFLRYLGSQSFASAKQLNLRVFEDQNIIEPILFRRSQWIPIHHVAYRTFHSISVSGSFDTMHLEKNNFSSYISESKDPILVSEALFSSKNYSDAPVSRHRVIAALKEWSGVTEIIPRDNAGRKSDLVYVTSVGTVLAKQRLSRLLLLGGDAIRDAIANDRVPVEVRDDFL